MPKVYDERPQSAELFLRLVTDASGAVYLAMVRADGPVEATLAEIDAEGIRLHGDFPPKLATRARFSPEALDTNGRLKVIGQESVEAERLGNVRYQCALRGSDHVLTAADGQKNLRVSVVERGSKCCSLLSPADTRDLAARLNRHVAFLDKEGL